MSFRIFACITAFALGFFVFGAGAARAQISSSPSPSATVFPALPPLPQPAQWPAILSETASAESIGPGVLYARWKIVTAAGPLELSLATIDLRNPLVSFAVGTHQDVIIGPGERLSSIADRLHAEVGINGDYFDINESGSPLNIVAINNNVLHSPDNAAAFVVDSSGRVQMGPLRWHAHLASANSSARDFDAVNEWGPHVDLALLTSQLGTRASQGAAEVVLSPAGEPGSYRVSRVDEDLAVLNSLAPQEIAVAARGKQAQALAGDFHLGDAVTLTTQTEPAFGGINIAIGGGPLLLRDGKPVIDPAPPAPEETNVRNPVTAAGTSPDGNTLWLVVVDGRAPGRSIGLTRPQLASLLVALGASEAMAFDSGGSSEMVVRHLGDLQSSVGNTPSDGRERAVADGLFVMNSATPGPVARIVMRAEKPAVLVGSHMRLSVRAVDANDQPVAIAPEDVSFHVSDPAAAAVDRNGLLAALQPAAVTVDATAFQAQSTSSVRIVPVVDSVSVTGYEDPVPLGGTVQLSVLASTRKGETVAVDPSAISWSAQGSSARVASGGALVVPGVAARTRVTAAAGGATATATVLSGDHPVAVQARLEPGNGEQKWHYNSRPAALPGGVDAASAPDGSPALRLSYDLSGSDAIRAAYAETTIALSGKPLAISVDVFGDGNGEWLRGGYRNADGNNESLTVARRVDWRGWKTIRVAIPKQSAWPIVWTRFYVVERARVEREQGALWLRQLNAYYAGPP